MTDKLEYYWSVPAYFSSVYPPVATDEIIQYAESYWDIVLPDKYKQLLKVQNGGYLAKKPREGLQDSIMGLPSVDGSWGDRTLYEIIYQVCDPDYKIDGSLKKVIILDGDGHWYVCMDFRNIERGGEPKIVYVDVECADENNFNDIGVLVVAPTFEAFFDSLDYFNCESSFLTAEPPESVVNILSAEYGFNFKYCNYGYDSWTVYKAAPSGPSVNGNSACRYRQENKFWGETRARYPHIPKSGTEISWVDMAGSLFSIEELKKLFPDLIVLHEDLD